MAITVSSEIKSIITIACEKLSLKSERSLAFSRLTELIQWHSMVKQLSIKASFLKRRQSFKFAFPFP